MAENIQTIKLPKGTWRFDLNSQLGETGGFGAVFAGVPEQDNFAVKRLSLDVGDLALREVDVASDLEGKEVGLFYSGDQVTPKGSMRVFKVYHFDQPELPF